jgi:hypothetical protein
MTSKKLGNLLRSVPPAVASEPSAALSEVPVPQPAPFREEQERRPTRTQPPVEPEVPLQVLIPKNIRKELALKAAEEGQSLRALILRAIRSLGIAVTEADIKGKRGRRMSS